MTAKVVARGEGGVVVPRGMVHYLSLLFLFSPRSYFYFGGRSVEIESSRTR